MTVGLRTAGQMVAALALAAMSAAFTPSMAASQNMEIWFGPRTWNIKPSGKGIEYTLHDFREFLAPGAPWARAESRLSVISLPGNVVWSYPDRQSIVAFFNRTKLKVAFGSGMLFNGGKCGVGFEGMSKDPDFNHETVKIAELWKQAGGRLDYIMMDSPYYFGNIAEGGCRYTIQEVARRVAATLHGVFHYYPNAKIIDAEGPGFTPNDLWLKGMDEFLADFSVATGRSMYAVAMDLHWKDVRPNETWIKTARKAIAFFHPLGLRVGLFIDADGTPQNLSSDAAWMQENRLHLMEAAQAHLDLDFESIESWTNVPKFNLPEDSPIAFTSLVNFAYDQLH
jgi:hypothetical protein